MLANLPRLIRWADVVHLTAAYSFPTMPTLLACRFARKPLVWSPRGAFQATHEWTGARRRTLKQIWERICSTLLSRKIFVLHVTSAQEQVASVARLQGADARIIRNGVELPAALLQRDWKPQGRFRLLYIGRLDPKKGIENLLRAIALLDDRTVTLEICGTGERSYGERLLSLAVDLGINGRVEFQGHVDGPDKAAAFARADLCVAPSYSENFCMVIAESLAHGVPVIASTGTPWREVFERGCGEWLDNSPASLAEGIKRMRIRPIEEMGRRGRSWMQQEFSWDAVAREMHQLYLSLLQERR